MVPAVVTVAGIFLLPAIVLTGGPVLPFLSAVLLHELGHLLGGILTGTPVRRFGAGILGLHLDFAMERVSYRQEFWVLVAGSLFGLFTLLWIPDPAYRTCALGLNLANLLPVTGLDGGGILSCFLHRITDGDRADRICHMVSLAAGILFWRAGMWSVLRVGPNPTWMLCGMAMAAGEIRSKR